MNTTITRELHDACIARHAALKNADPELTARATARGVWIAAGSPEQTLLHDLTALDDVAQSFATGVRPKAKNMRRALALLA